MPKYDVRTVLQTTKFIDGERKSFKRIIGSSPCEKCGYEHGKPVEEDVTLGSVLVDVLQLPPQDEKKKKSGKDALEDFKLALDIEIALNSKDETQVEISMEKAVELQERTAEAGNWNRFILAQIYQLLEKKED